MEYLNNENAGTATAILTGTGEPIDVGGKTFTFVGEVRKTFKITGTALSKAEIKNLPKSVPYTGEEYGSLTSLGSNVSVGLKKSTTELKQGTDFDIAFSKNVDAGTATILLTGKGGYTGTLKKTFKITAYDLSKNEGVTADKIKVTAKLDKDSYQLTTENKKKGVQPQVSVQFGDTVLRQGVDYTVKLKNNKKVGTAGSGSKAPAVIITGKGNFTKAMPAIPFTITD